MLIENVNLNPFAPKLAPDACERRSRILVVVLSLLLTAASSIEPAGGCPIQGSSTKAAQGTKAGLKAQSDSGAQPNSGSTQPDVAALMQQAGDALEHKDYRSALDPLKTVTAKPSANTPEEASQTAIAWYYLGYAYHGLQQNEESRRAYEKAVELKPDLYQAQLNLGRLLVEMRDPGAALPHLQKAAALKPADARLHFDIGLALQSRGQSAAAEPELRQALALDPKLDAAAYSLGQAEFDEKRYAEAAADFEKALAINPQRADARLGLATVSEALGQTGEAEQRLEQCLKLQPENASVRFHLARLYLREKKIEPAVSHLEQLDKSNALIPGLDAALGDAYALAGRFSDSETSYRKALAAARPEASGNGDLADLHRSLGETLLKENKTSDAVSEFQQALKLDPRNLEAAKGLASSLYVEKRWSEAALLIERLLQSPAATPGFYFFLATCYDHLRDRQRALDAYKQFLAQSKGSNPDQEWQALQRAKLLSRELGKSL
jgi:tetratricopeptide (TPR) repeat protein